LLQKVISHYYEVKIGLIKKNNNLIIKIEKNLIFKEKSIREMPKIFRNKIIQITLKTELKIKQ
jgi:uncharacterized membrane-anchored protein